MLDVHHIPTATKQSSHWKLYFDKISSGRRRESGAPAGLHDQSFGQIKPAKIAATMATIVMKVMPIGHLLVINS